MVGGEASTLSIWDLAAVCGNFSKITTINTVLPLYNTPSYNMYLDIQ